MEYATTSIDNWEKYIETGDETFLNDLNLFELKKGDKFILASQGGAEKEVEVK